MKAFVTRYIVRNMLEETGDDFTHIHIFFRIDDRHESKIPAIVTYDELVYFIDNLKFSNEDF